MVKDFEINKLIGSEITSDSFRIGEIIKIVLHSI